MQNKNDCFKLIVLYETNYYVLMNDYWKTCKLL